MQWEPICLLTKQNHLKQNENEGDVHAPSFKKRGYVYRFRGLAKKEPRERFSIMFDVKMGLPTEDRHRIIDDGVLVVTLLFMIIDACIHAIDKGATGDELHGEGFAAIEIHDKFIV